MRRAPACYRLNRENMRSEEHTSELQSQSNLVCRLLLEKKKSAQCLRATLSDRLQGLLGNASFIGGRFRLCQLCAYLFLLLLANAQHLPETVHERAHYAL